MTLYCWVHALISYHWTETERVLKLGLVRLEETSKSKLNPSRPPSRTWMLFQSNEYLDKQTMSMPQSYKHKQNNRHKHKYYTSDWKDHPVTPHRWRRVLCANVSSQTSQLLRGDSALWLCGHVSHVRHTSRHHHECTRWTLLFLVLAAVKLAC